MKQLVGGMMDFHAFLTWVTLSFVMHMASSNQICHSVNQMDVSHMKFQHDQASFVVQIKGLVKSKDTSITLKGISDNCYKCELQECGHGTDFISVIVGTDFPFRYTIFKDEEEICSNTYHFAEHGHYHIYLLNNDKMDQHVCSSIKVIDKGPYPYLPLLVLFGILALSTVFYMVGIIIWKSFSFESYVSMKQSKSKSDEFINSFSPDVVPRSLSRVTKPIARRRVAKRLVIVPDDGYSSQLPEASLGSFDLNESETRLSSATSLNLKTKKVRVKSLDTFRGISITLMIFVNYGGGKYWFFNHSKWNGLTVADLVFPWFIFIMGFSIFISCNSLLRKGISRKNIALKIIVRAVKLFAVGLFLNNGYDFNSWRIPGVLQRFAVSYLVVALLNIAFTRNEVDLDALYWYDWRDSVRDIILFPWQHLVMIALLISHVLITFYVHDPACPKGYLGPGGLAEGGKYYNCTGGAAGYIDRTIFGLKHIYNRPTCKVPYKCIPFDPEGILGIIPSIILTYFGLQASRMLFMYSSSTSRVKRWLLWTAIWGLIAIGLCGASQNDGIIPINKNLWSLSFIFATGSLAYLLLTFCYILVDVKAVWSGTPFHFAGMNAIMLYVGHEILHNYFPFNFKNDGSHAELLTRSVVGTMIWLLIAYYAFKKNLFFKL